MLFFCLDKLYFGRIPRIKILPAVDRCGPRSNLLFLISKEVIALAGGSLAPLLPQRQLCGSLAACLSITSIIFINFFPLKKNSMFSQLVTRIIC